MTVRARPSIGAGILATILVLLLSGVSTAQVPEIETPKALQPYANTQDVLKTAGELIDLLASARFDATGEFTNKAFLSGNCNTEEYHAAFRGYQLIKAAYFVFTSKIERGWYDSDPPDGWYETPQKDSIGFANPHRLILARVWNGESLSKLAQLTSRLTALPAPVKTDLVAFFGKLRDFKRYHSFLARAPKALAGIKERVADQCDLQRYNYLQAIEKGQVDTARGKIDRVTAKSELDRCESQQLYDEGRATKAYRELINAVRDPDAPAISACLDGGGGYYGKTYLGMDGAIVKYSVLHPNYYMLRFWERRQAEGTTMLAMFFLNRVLDGLK